MVQSLIDLKSDPLAVRRTGLVMFLPNFAVDTLEMASFTPTMN